MSAALPCEESAATAISNDLRIVGWCERDGRIMAFAYRPAPEVELLPRLPGSRDDRAHGVSLAGIVVGESNGRAVLWLPGAGAETIPGLPGGSRSAALDIDERGTVSGIAWLPTGAAPWTWQPSGGTRVGAALAAPARPARRLFQLGDVTAELRDTNEAGSALLTLQETNHPSAAALVRRDGTLWRLDPVVGGAGVEPLDLSDTCEWVVGYTVDRSGRRRATWWRRSC